MDVKPFSLDFSPNPVQRQFIESRATADLFSSRVGEGKSTALVWSIFYHTRHNPGANWVVIRDTMENLKRSTLKSFFEWFPPGVAGTYHSTDKVFTWAKGLAEGTVTFIGMDDPTDATKLLSWEMAGFAMDEPAPASGSAGIDETVFDLAMTRLRQPNMKWFGVKLATNNPDESHWTYRKFVSPGVPGFKGWQPVNPENKQNLPVGYYEGIRSTLAHRPDLIRRFVDGEYGFQSEGVAVTPQWNDRMHLANGLAPLKKLPIHLLWDFGLNPTCIVTQKTPLGHWLILDAMVGDGIGTEELIIDWVKPLLAERYRGNPLSHIGDPAGNTREASSSKRSAVASLRRELGGTFRAGPLRIWDRINPMQAVLSRTIRGVGVVQVDRDRAQPIWYALRGGWHFHKARTGVVGSEPKKNEHSHPGDAISYGAAVLFPVGKWGKGPAAPGVGTAQQASHWGSNGSDERAFRIGPGGQTPPAHGTILGIG